METEVDRVIQAAAQTRQRFYQKYGFFVLPRLIPGPAYRQAGKASLVFLPNLDFDKIPGFWPIVEKTKLNIPMPVAKRIHQEAAQLLIKSQWQLKDKKAKELKKKLKSEWGNKESLFWQTLLKIFPDLAKKKIEVEIRPTKFGSVSSFNLSGTKRKELIVRLYIRLDMFPAQIAEAILSSLFKPKLEKEGYGWEETEGVIDFLLRFTQLSKIFPDYQPTLRAIRDKEEGKLLIESQKYLKKLGIPTSEIFSLHNNQVLIDGKTPQEKFSANEAKVIRLLIANKNHLCSFDQIGDLIWEEKADELFSVWAISKLTQRIRIKLQANGISPAVIQTQRGQGYVLRD